MALKLTPDSSQVYGHEYDPATQRLTVAFKSNHVAKHYVYKGVTPERAAELDAAESKGSFMHKIIKPQHDFEVVPSTTAPQAESEGGII